MELKSACRKMTEPEDHINILINASIVADDEQESEVTTDDERLLRKPYKPRNNFPSYSNEGVSVRFRV